MFAREALGVDWLALRWSEALEGTTLPCDPAHLVLTHAHSPQAVAWGVAQGIATFEGRAVRPPDTPAWVARRRL